MTAETAEPNDTGTRRGWLRELRGRHGWTQQELARRLTVARPTVARWETGAAAPMGIFRRTLDRLGRDVGLGPCPKE